MRSSRRPAFAAALALAALAVGGCAGRRPPSLPPTAARIAITPEIAGVLDRVRARDARKTTGRALFESDLALAGREVARAMKGVLYFQKPDRLRIRTFGPMGLAAFDLAMTGDSVRALAPEGLDLGARPQFRAMVRGLAGTVFGAPLPAGDVAAYRGASGHLLIATPADGKPCRDLVEIDPATARVARRVMGPGTRDEIAVDFSDFRDAGGFDEPFAIRVRVPAAGIELRVRVAEYGFNEPLPDGTFPE